jgi:hypothetical protein
LSSRSGKETENFAGRTMNGRRKERHYLHHLEKYKTMPGMHRDPFMQDVGVQNGRELAHTSEAHEAWLRVIIVEYHDIRIRMDILSERLEI